MWLHATHVCPLLARKHMREAAMRRSATKQPCAAAGATRAWQWHLIMMCKIALHCHVYRARQRIYFLRPRGSLHVTVPRTVRYDLYCPWYYLCHVYPALPPREGLVLNPHAHLLQGQVALQPALRRVQTGELRTWR